MLLLWPKHTESSARKAPYPKVRFGIEYSPDLATPRICSPRTPATKRAGRHFSIRVYRAAYLLGALWLRALFWIEANENRPPIIISCLVGALTFLNLTPHPQTPPPTPHPQTPPPVVQPQVQVVTRFTSSIMFSKIFLKQFCDVILWTSNVEVDVWSVSIWHPNRWQLKCFLKG